MKKILSFVLIFAVFSQELLACKLWKDSEDGHLCESWDELASAGSQPEWKKLIVINSGTLEKTLLKNGAFKDVPNVDHLYIKGLVNKIEPAVFKQLPNLKHLFLIENEIESLPEGIFDGLQKLQFLKINHCQLKNIQSGTIFNNTNIVSLDLSNNSISTIEDCAFCGMKDLKTLNLQNNLLTSLEPERILGETRILEIEVDGNKLTKLPKFDSFPNLRVISAANNSIEEIEANALAKCPLLTLLEVSGNKLKEIPANIFPDFGDRKESMFLVIHQNKIECLSQELRDKIKILSMVTVNDNPWKCECLNDIIDWAKVRGARVECAQSDTSCKVECVDKNDKKQMVDTPVY